MTAMVSVKATTRQERLDAARAEWIQSAITYLFKIGVYAPDELEGANELAEILWDSSDNEDYFDDHALFQSAEDAVDEELTYWGRLIMDDDLWLVLMMWWVLMMIVVTT